MIKYIISNDKKGYNFGDFIKIIEGNLGSVWIDGM
jgi:hypothetical protein